MQKPVFLSPPRHNVGMQFFDMADFTNAVRANKLNTHCTGLQLGVDGIGGVFIGHQKHTGNLWDLSAIGGSCLGGRNYGNPAASPFFVNGTANSALNPDVSPSTGWFTDVPGTTFNTCVPCNIPGALPPEVPESDEPTELDELIATDSLEYEVFEDEMHWKGAYRLYRKILRQPAIEEYASEYADFKAANDSLTLGRLAWIAEARATLFALDSSEYAGLDNRRALWYGKMLDLFELDSLLQAGDSVGVALYDTTVVQNAEAWAQYREYADDLKEARLLKIDSLLGLNAAVGPGLRPEFNHKTVNGIALNLLKSDTLAAGALDTLEAIAMTCPLEGGDAVYEARAIVAHYTGGDFDDIELCADAEERQQGQKSRVQPTTSDAILFYPNPTTGLLFWTGTGDGPVSVRVFNTLGQQVVEITSANGPVNLGRLPEGLYQVQLLASDNTPLATSQVQLIKR